MLYGRIYPRHIRGETPASPTSGTPESTARPYYMTWLLNFVRWSICMRVTASKGLQHRPTHGAGLGGGGQNFCDPQHFIIPFDLDDWLFIALNVIFLGQRLWAFVGGSQNAEALEPRSLGRGVADP